MSSTFRALLAAVALNAVFPLTAVATTPASSDAANVAISQQLLRYEEALNSSDLDRVMTLYANDAVFMPQGSLPAVGRDAVRTAYRRVFDSIKLNIRFQIDEIRTLSRDWAYARTRSSGTVKVLGSNQPPGPEANQELFLLHRETGGQWRFVRYIFATTDSPK
ncbi:SgcJ/EcaC family oxidoreductase [Paraburkholderia sediminicola]|uniref:YybH family protein n=1 Tax=Paraburkholderia sediminicola TaxID=458836 RepID=UPI0038BDE88C